MRTDAEDTWISLGEVAERLVASLDPLEGLEGQALATLQRHQREQFRISGHRREHAPDEFESARLYEPPRIVAV